MDRIIKPMRLAVLTLLLVVLSAVTLTSLYKAQIIDGAKNSAAAQNSIASTVVVPAARGNIHDRYGRALTTNRACNNLIINSDELFEQPDPNAVILELVQTVLDAGDTYIDTVPITMEPPFEFVPNMTDIQKTRLDAYIKAREAFGLSSSSSAVEIMADFRERYKIDNNYTATEMRIIAGIRYEINIRYLVNTSDYVFAEDVSIDLITRLLENSVPGFRVISSYVREYNTTAAAHVLGYIGMMNEREVNTYMNQDYPLNALVGKDGIEMAFESELHGVDGLAQIISTRGGTVISMDYEKEVSPGNNVFVTLDIGMQEVGENAMKSHIETENVVRQELIDLYEASPGMVDPDDVKQLITGGAVVAIHIPTGEPLCIASYPTFDVSAVFDSNTATQETESGSMFNRALQGAYAPGSTFKPVTALAALDHKTSSGNSIITLTSTIYDNVIFDEFADEGYAPRCWIYPHTHGDVDVVEAVRVSCNYFFYTVGKDLGIDAMSRYAARFGLGEPTGIELYEELGHMATQEHLAVLEDRPWYIGDTLQAAIGQSVTTFTPLQLANYVAAIANDGLRYEASVLKSVRSYDYSESFYERIPVVADDFQLSDERFYDAVQLGMYKAANASPGTVVYNVFSDFQVNVAAKTGTAQLGTKITNNGIFICYAPYENPEIAVAVVLEKGGAGAECAEIARSVLDYYFNFKNSAASSEKENSLLR